MCLKEGFMCLDVTRSKISWGRWRMKWDGRVPPASTMERRMCWNKIPEIPLMGKNRNKRLEVHGKPVFGSLISSEFLEENIHPGQDWRAVWFVVRFLIWSVQESSWLSVMPKYSRDWTSYSCWLCKYIGGSDDLSGTTGWDSEILQDWRTCSIYQTSI